jgi:hypothetical protein
LCVSAGVLAAGASYPPRSYWRFEDATNPFVDSEQKFDLQPTNPSLCSVESASGLVGSYLRFNSTDNSTALAAAAGHWNCNTASGCTGVTVEFLVRIGHNFNLHGNTAVLRSHGQGSAFTFETQIGRHSYEFHAGSDPAFPIQDIAGNDVITRLNGTGTRSPFYLNDGQWHHFAFRKRANPSNKKTCEARIWIDGESQTSFGSMSAPGPTPCSYGSGETITFLNDSFAGDIDEVAVWEVPLTDSIIHAHAVGALQEKKPYCVDDPGGVVPPVPNRTGEFDLKEFAPGTQLPSPAGAPTQGVTISCLEQLQTFPTQPRPLTASCSRSRTVWTQTTWRGRTRRT